MDPLSEATNVFMFSLQLRTSGTQYAAVNAQEIPPNSGDFTNERQWWNIWKGFACFSSLSWFRTLESTEPPLKSPQLGLQKDGASLCAHSYSVQWSGAMWGDLSASTRPQCEGGGVAGSPNDFRKKPTQNKTLFFRQKSEKQLNSGCKSRKKGSRINCEIVK